MTKKTEAVLNFLRELGFTWYRIKILNNEKRRIILSSCSVPETNVYYFEKRKILQQISSLAFMQQFEILFFTRGSRLIFLNIIIRLLAIPNDQIVPTKKGRERERLILFIFLCRVADAVSNLFLSGYALFLRENVFAVAVRINTSGEGDLCHCTRSEQKRRNS